MKKLMVLVIGCLVVLSETASAQEVVIVDFPIGVGTSISQDFFRPYYNRLKAIADTLHKYPHSQVIITGCADASRYDQDNDSRNPALALGRAHALSSFLRSEFNIDSTQVMIQSQDRGVKGADFRSVSVRISRMLSDLETRVDMIDNRPPVEKDFTVVREVPSQVAEQLGLRFGAGLSTSPYGGIPVVTGAVVWKRKVYLEASGGHTFWRSNFRFRNVDLNTRRRLISGHVSVFPLSHLPIGLVGGWIRIEEVSQMYYKYVRLSEGPLLGLRADPIRSLSVMMAYNPANQRTAGDITSRSKNSQFLLSITANLPLGGAN